MRWLLPIICTFVILAASAPAGAQSKLDRFAAHARDWANQQTKSYQFYYDQSVAR